jgi:hypothetical protein
MSQYLQNKLKAEDHKQAVIEFRETLASGNPIDRVVAARALGEIGDEGSVPLLRSVISDENKNLRKVVLDALEKIRESKKIDKPMNKGITLKSIDPFVTVLLGLVGLKLLEYLYSYMSFIIVPLISIMVIFLFLKIVKISKEKRDLIATQIYEQMKKTVEENPYEDLLKVSQRMIPAKMKHLRNAMKTGEVKHLTPYERKLYEFVVLEKMYLQVLANTEPLRNIKEKTTLEFLAEQKKEKRADNSLGGKKNLNSINILSIWILASFGEELIDIIGEFFVFSHEMKIHIVLAIIPLINTLIGIKVPFSSEKRKKSKKNI